jgi:hypothetical protein
MFFQDELLSWSWRRPLGMPLAPISGGGGTNPIEFKQKVTTNVEHVIGRITGIAPQYFSEEVSACLRFHYVREFLVKKDQRREGNGEWGCFPFFVWMLKVKEGMNSKETCDLINY